MRYVSEQFKEMQDEIIRPAIKLFFEVGSNVRMSMKGLDGEAYAGDMGFDDDVAPVVEPDVCTNGHYYAVLGDDVPVDDPNLICAPDVSEGMYDLPTVSVPYGITTFTPANTETLIGSDTEEYWHNFSGFTTRSTLCFKGLIPSQIRVQSGAYDIETDTFNWTDEQIIDNSDLKEEIVYYPLPSGDERDLYYRRFWVKNSSNAGRFQLNWIRLDFSARYDSDRLPVVFENELISNVSINENTDLTSQSLPSYEITVECLDVDEIYTPESSYWNKQFNDGSTFCFKAGFETEGGIEYIPLLIGELTKKPTYGNGKITFKTSIEFRWFFGDLETASKPNSSYATGAEVESEYFKEIIDNATWEHNLFDNYDIFSDADDELNSVCNYYGTIKEPRQLIANALGGYITSNVYTFDLHRTVDIQYKPYSDYLSRYEQINNTLESQPKVTKISVTRNQNTASADKVTVDTPTAITLLAGEGETLYFTVPFEALSKFVVTDYRKSVSTAVVTAEFEYVDNEADGTHRVALYFEANKKTNIRPKVDFYRVDNTKFEEIVDITIGSLEGEVYTNDNDLITNSYIADKVKRVGRLINDMTDQYEVDYMQDFRYEVGDVIRLETIKDIYKTCVITSLTYNLPGSAGHLTCRKIFSLYDSSYSVIDAEGLIVECKDNDVDVLSLTVLKTNENACAIGYLDAGSHLYLLVLGTDKAEVEEGGNTDEVEPNAILTDLNNHDWHFNYFDISIAGVGSVDTPAPAIELPDYDPDSGVSVGAFLAVEMLKKIYEAQNMTAPVNYTCDWQQT